MSRYQSLVRGDLPPIGTPGTIGRFEIITDIPPLEDFKEEKYVMIRYGITTVVIGQLFLDPPITITQENRIQASQYADQSWGTDRESKMSAYRENKMIGDRIRIEYNIAETNGFFNPLLLYINSARVDYRAWHQISMLYESNPRKVQEIYSLFSRPLYDLMRRRDFIVYDMSGYDLKSIFNGHNNLMRETPEDEAMGVSVSRGGYRRTKKSKARRKRSKYSKKRS